MSKQDIPAKATTEPAPEQSASEAARRFRYGVLGAMAVLVLAAGFLGGQRFAARTDAELRSGLLEQASAVARAIDPELVKSLSFSLDDENRPEFQRLRTQMRAYSSALGLTSLYSMALRDGRIVFGPEIFQAKDPMASRPGTVYRHPAAEDLGIFQNGKVVAFGPQTDEYGVFISTLAPVKDPATGKVLMVVGMDLDAAIWQRAILRARWLPRLLVPALLAALAAGAMALEWRERRPIATWGPLRHLETVLCAAFGLLLTGVGGWFAHDAERSSRLESFTALAQAQAEGVATAFPLLRDQLELMGRSFETGERVNRAAFRDHAEPLVRDKMVEAWAWVPAVGAAEVTSLVERARADGLADFSVWQPDASDQHTPARGRDVFYPVLFTEPAADAGLPLGRDLGVEPQCLAGLEAAAKTGLTMAVEVKAAGLPEGAPPDLLVLRPVFSRRESPKRFLGSVVMRLRLPSVLRAALVKAGRAEPEVAANLFHLVEGRRPRFVAASVADEDLQREAARLFRPLAGRSLTGTVPVFFFGETFALVFRPEPSFLSQHRLWSGWLAGMAGLMLTGLLTGLGWLLGERRMELEKQVETRTAALQAAKVETQGLLRKAELAHRTLENMVAVQKAAEEALLESQALLQTAMDCSQAGIAIADAPSGRLRYVNRSGRRICGGSDSDLVEGVDLSNYAERWHLRNLDASPMSSEDMPLAWAIQKGEPCSQEFIIRRPNDEERIVWGNASPVLDASGNVLAGIMVFLDITARRSAEEKIRLLNAGLEQRVAERTAQLEAANKELEAFSYSVSHDLRAPLRAVSGYAGILHEDYSWLLDGEGHRVLNVISAEADRMGLLIDDLLAFSRLGRQAVQRADVDQQALATAVFNELSAHVPDRHLRFKATQMPRAQGDPSLLRQVWVNLLDNAIKYTRRAAEAHIEAGSLTSGTEVVYFVKDNGVGFDMRYANKLFGVFQRLHGEAEFEGTGVGLALSQRIIHRHGGRIWAEAQLDQGATFYFTIPDGPSVSGTVS